MNFTPCHESYNQAPYKKGRYESELVTKQVMFHHFEYNHHNQDALFSFTKRLDIPFLSNKLKSSGIIQAMRDDVGTRVGWFQFLVSLPGGTYTMSSNFLKKVQNNLIN